MNRKMCFVAMVLSLIVMLVIGCKEKGLDGVWTGKEVEAGDQVWTFTFAGDKVRVESDEGSWFDMTIQLIENSQPRQAMLHVDDSSVYGAVGLELKSIYQMKGKQLTIVVNDPQQSDVMPTSFEKSWETRVFELTRK